jgi:copper homeostasis protein
MILLEVCANSVSSALAAQTGGALRVELCENLQEGGTTPSFGQILMARKLLHIKLYVLVRPRGGDFLYNDNEYETMLADVRYCIESGCDGIVIGILNADGTVDKDRNREIVRMAKQWGLGITFHRAFDMCANQLQAMEDIIELGFERILTSGGKSTAMEGASVIANLVNKAAGRIIIMPGSGINPSNVTDLVKYTKVQEIHSSAKIPVQSQMKYKNDHILMGDFGEEYTFEQTDVELVKGILKKANGGK